MPRDFAGGTDRISVNIGSAGVVGALTIAAIVYLTGDNTDDRTILYAGTATTGSARYALYVNQDSSGVKPTFRIGNTAVASNTNMTKNDWVLLAASRDGGSGVSPKFHKYIYSTNTWSHETPSGGTHNDGTAPATTAYIGNSPTAGTGDFIGTIGIVGVWDSNLTDAQIEDLAYSLEGWWTGTPVSVWPLDQQLTTTKVLDWTGNGANESALSGTTVATRNEPVFTYGHEILYVTHDHTTLKTLAATVATTVTLLQTRSRILLATVATTVTKRLNVGFHLTAIATTVPVPIKLVSHKFATFITGSTSTLRRDVFFTRKATQATSVTVSFLRVILRSISATVSNTTSVFKRTGKNAIATCANSVSFGNFNIGKKPSVNQATVVTKNFFLSRSVVATCASVASVIKRDLLTAKSMTVSSTTTLRKQVGKILLAQVVTLVTLPGKRIFKNLNFQTGSVQLIKKCNHAIVATQASTASLRRMSNKYLAALIVPVFDIPFVIHVLKIIQTSPVVIFSFTKLVKKILSAVVGSTSTLRRRAGKILAANVATQMQKNFLLSRTIQYSQITYPYIIKQTRKTIAFWQFHTTIFDRYRVLVLKATVTTITTFSWLYATWKTVGFKLVGFVYKVTGLKVEGRN